jgi:hypothetical protein
MSLNVTAVCAATPLPVVGRTAPARPAQDAGSDAVIVDLTPSSPRPEERGAIAPAGQSSAQLGATDRQLRFTINDRTGKVSVAVHDLRGHVLFAVPSTNVLDSAPSGTR